MPINKCLKSFMELHSFFEGNFKFDLLVIGSVHDVFPFGLQRLQIVCQVGCLSFFRLLQIVIASAQQGLNLGSSILQVREHLHESVKLIFSSFWQSSDRFRCGQSSINIAQPGKHVLHLLVEGLGLSEGILQLGLSVLSLAEQSIPLGVQLIQLLLGLGGFSGSLLGLNYLSSGIIESVHTGLVSLDVIDNDLQLSKLNLDDLRVSRVLSVLSIQTSSSLSACWNCPSLRSACSSSFCLMTMALLRSVHLLFTSARGSLMALAWSGEVLSVRSSACLFSASTLTIHGSTSSLNFFRSSICLLTVAMSAPMAPRLSNLVSLLARNSSSFWSMSWNSIAFSMASRRFLSLLAYMEVMLSQAPSRSSMCLLSSGFSESPTTPRRAEPDFLQLSTAGLVPSMPLLMSCSSLF